MVLMKAQLEKFMVHRGLLLVLLLVFPLQARGAEGWRTVGIAGGYNAVERFDDYDQLTLYGEYGFSQGYSWPSGWNLQLNLCLLTSMLRNHRDMIFMASVGPGATVSRPGSRFSFTFGSGAGLLSEQVLERRNFGGHIHMLTYYSFTWQLTDRIDMGYRYHHMSNLFIYDENPGINLHMITLGYRF